MASIARCMRIARPTALSFTTTSLRQTAVRSTTIKSSFAARAFSATAISPIRKYTKDHEWIDLAADSQTGVIGISEYAAEALGDVVYVELPEDGKSVAQGDAIGAVESVKSAADINAPISCRVTHVNLELEQKPGTINQVPEDDSAGGGWIAKVVVEGDGAKEFEALLSAEEYKAFTADADH